MLLIDSKYLLIDSKYSINKECLNNLFVVGVSLYSNKPTTKSGSYWYDLKGLDCGTITILI